MSNGKESSRVATIAVCLLILLGGMRVSAADSGNGYLKVKANPNHAGVFVDGKYMGPAANFGFARKYAVAAGEHEVVLRDPRCEDYSTKVTITAGKTSTISQTLQPATLAKPPFGNLRVEGGSSKFDAVYVNDKFMGHVDEFNNFAQGLLLNPGEYNLKVVSPDGKTELEQKIKIDENKTTHVKVGAAT
jgi:hypothetical protein